MWNSPDTPGGSERKVVLYHDWGKTWIRQKWAGYTVFVIKYDGEVEIEKVQLKETNLGKLFLPVENSISCLCQGHQLQVSIVSVG